MDRIWDIEEDGRKVHKLILSTKDLLEPSEKDQSECRGARFDELYVPYHYGRIIRNKSIDEFIMKYKLFILAGTFKVCHQYRIKVKLYKSFSNYKGVVEVINTRTLNEMAGKGDNSGLAGFKNDDI